MPKYGYYPLAEEYSSLKNIFKARSLEVTRTPRRGEWYLSGAITEAYCAPNDLNIAYPIAELVLR